MAFLFISSFDTLANLRPARSLASKFCCSMYSQLTVVPTHTAVHSAKIGLSNGWSQSGYEPENHQAIHRHIVVRPVPPNVKPFALRSLMSNILFDEKRDIGIADSALSRPAISSDVRKIDEVAMYAEVSMALVRCE